MAARPLSLTLANPCESKRSPVKAKKSKAVSYTHLLGSVHRFNERFAGPIERNRDREAQHVLKRLVGPFILRRTKSEVLQDLPCLLYTSRCV